MKATDRHLVVVEVMAYNLLVSELKSNLCLCQIMCSLADVFADGWVAPSHPIAYHNNNKHHVQSTGDERQRTVCKKDLVYGGIRPGSIQNNSAHIINYYNYVQQLFTPDRDRGMECSIQDPSSVCIPITDEMTFSGGMNYGQPMAQRHD